jgi:hypothetical protein
MGRRGRDRDRMEVGFTTPYAIGANFVRGQRLIGVMTSKFNFS